MNQLLLDKLITSSVERKIPILRPQSFALLASLLSKYNCKTVLEIGSATGVTAFRLEEKGLLVTSIEQNEELYKECVTNKLNLDSQVDFILGDARTYEFKGQFDCVFIDGAKAHYQAFFTNTVSLCPKLVFLDNINFGIKDISQYPPRLHPICRKMKQFIDNIRNDERFYFTLYLIEDGVIVLVKK